MRLSCYWQWISSQHCQNSLRIYSAIASWIHSYFDNVMTKFMIIDRTDALKTDVNLLSFHETKQAQNFSVFCKVFSYIAFRIMIAPLNWSSLPPSPTHVYWHDKSLQNLSPAPKFNLNAEVSNLYLNTISN